VWLVGLLDSAAGMLGFRETAKNGGTSRQAVARLIDPEVSVCLKIFGTLPARNDARKKLDELCKELCPERQLKDEALKDLSGDEVCSHAH